jgi:penicillin-binding protein 2
LIGDWRSTLRTRRSIFLGGSALLFGALTVRLAELQILRGQEYETKAEENRIRLDPAPPARGTIFDREGRQLATNKRNFYVTLRPELAGGPAAIERIVRQLGEALALSETRQRALLQEIRSQPKFVDVLVADDLTWEDFARINVMAPELAGVTAEVGELRSYPYYAAFYHTIGYVQKANDRDVERMIKAELDAAGEAPDTKAGQSRASAVRRLYRHPQMRIGKQGIEAYAENNLKGVPGKQPVLVNAAGRVIDRMKPTDDIAAKPGVDVVLTIDAELQNYAIQRFGTEDQSGSAIVIDIPTGDVLVMMSTPAPDPNEFVSGISSASYKGLLESERNPLYHKAYEGVYPPGSTFKMVVAAAALEAGVITPETRVHCSGRAWYYNRFYHCWKPRGHGSVNLHTGLQNSCDCYFYAVAERVGIEKIAEMAKKFGLGHRYELGLTGGKAGVMPNNEWKLGAVGERWYPGDTISAAIGQGYVTTTPFQLAVMTARIAGGQSAAHPHLVASGVEVPDPTYRELGEISEETLNRLRAGMFAVTSEPGGTALRFGELDPNGELPAPFTNCRMSGKSGTAQVRVIRMEERDAQGKAIDNSKLPWRLRDHALFVAYAPHDNPRYACAIVVEHGGSGSNVAAPFARDILFATLKANPAARKPFSPKREVAAAEPEGQPT